MRSSTEASRVVVACRLPSEPALVRDTSSLGASSLGVWTRAEALAALSPGQIDDLVRTRTWQVLWRGVYADGGYVPDAEQRAWAAVLATGGTTVRPAGMPGAPRQVRSVACGRTAARLWLLPLIDDADPGTGADEHRFDDVCSRRRLPRQNWGGRELRPLQRALRPGDVVRLPSGLWVTTPLRTLVDCASLLSREALVCAADAALHRQLVRTDDLHAAAEQQHGQRGAVALRHTAAFADGRAESPGESLARLLLLPALPGFEPQVELFDHAARLVARFDLGDRAVRLAVEADGKSAHAGQLMVAKDRRRDRRTEALGWHTERVTWYELRRQSQAFVSRVADAHARRTAA